MILSDKTIKKLIEEKNLITPFNQEHLSSNSYDLTQAEDDNTLVLQPGESRCIVTKETLNLPDNVVAKTVSKSSTARCGVSIGDIGGWIDAGYRGQLTLLAVNHGDSLFRLKNLDSICQIIFMQADSNAEQPYNGHYQDSVGYRGAWFLDKENSKEDFKQVVVKTDLKPLNQERVVKDDNQGRRK